MTVRYLKSAGVIAALWTTAVGCADTQKKPPTTQPLTLEQRNKKILDDPMSVGPNSDPGYVAEHGLGPDDKPSMKKDIDNFLNP
jgi:hypothetical protein